MWRGGRLAAGLARWRTFARGSRAAEMRSAALALQCRDRFITWRDNASRSAKVRRALQTFSGRRSKHWLGAHFRGWASVSLAQVFHREVTQRKMFLGWARASKGSGRRNQDALGRAMLLWSGNTVRRSFAQWSGAVKERCTYRQKAAAALVRAFTPMLVRAEGRAFTSWKAGTLQA